jgi:hypothetical protein
MHSLKAVFSFFMEINSCLFSNVASLKLQPLSTQEKPCMQSDSKSMTNLVFS